MMSVTFKENIRVPPPALHEIILAANHDIRQVRYMCVVCLYLFVSLSNTYFIHNFEVHVNGRTMTKKHIWLHTLNILGYEKCKIGIRRKLGKVHRHRVISHRVISHRVCGSLI